MLSIVQIEVNYNLILYSLFMSLSRSLPVFFLGGGGGGLVFFRVFRVVFFFLFFFVDFSEVFGFFFLGGGLMLGFYPSN